MTEGRGFLVRLGILLYRLGLGIAALFLLLALLAGGWTAYYTLQHGWHIDTPNGFGLAATTAVIAALSWLAGRAFLYLFAGR